MRNLLSTTNFHLTSLKKFKQVKNILVKSYQNELR